MALTGGARRGTASAQRMASRLRDDLMPRDRGDEYAALLRQALESGYSIISLRDFAQRVREDRVHAGPGILVIRHDVDIDNVAGNEMLWGIERAAGVGSTYYFRASTAPSHHAFIERLLTAGHEVGYHFEEGATLAKRHRLRSRDQVLARRDEVADLFVANCHEFRQTYAPDMVSVSSHGDWINRRLGFTNNELVDEATMHAAGLSFEAYDASLMDAAEAYVSDVAPAWGQWARGLSLQRALSDGVNPIYLLAHERRWHTNVRANIRQDVQRLTETIAQSYRG